ncbi:MAG TPA: hypothetical protein VMF59_16440, partial [Bacteroidota bacterium]|nr:hypothetical protein [Bacteroidota bacterium]
TIAAEVLARHQVAACLIPLALEGRWFTPGLLDAVLQKEGFTGAQIARRIVESLRNNNQGQPHAKHGPIQPYISIH